MTSRRKPRGKRHVATVVIPINPVPASRPRVTRWGTYFAKTYRNWRDLAASSLTRGTLDLVGPLDVIVTNIVRRPKTTKLEFPKPDVDNFAKAALDAVTKAGGYWVDDHQVISLTTSKRWTEPGEQPCTVIDIYHHHRIPIRVVSNPDNDPDKR